MPEPNWPPDDEATAPAVYPSHAEAVALHGPRFQQNPAELYAELRRQHGPVAPVLLEGGIPAWFVMGYREVHHVLSNDQLYARDSRRWREWDRIPPDWPLMSTVGYQPSVVFCEGAEHRRRSGAISDALFGVDQFELRSQTERIADQLIDEFVGIGEADLMSGYAFPAPLLVLAKQFGLSDQEGLNLLGDMIATVDGAEDAQPAFQRMMAMMGQLMERSRAYPGPNIPSRLAYHEAALTDEELVNDLTTTMIAAHRPMADWIGNTLRLMLTDPRFAVSLAGGRRSVGQAMNEVLWEDTPTQNYIGRWASRNTQLGGQQIKAGDLLVLGLAAANTDPQVRPDSFEDTKGNQAQMSFSHGEHACPYPASELADVICRTTIEVLLDRLPDVVLAVPPTSLVWSPSVWMRSLTSLPVRFTPAYVG